MGETGMKNNIVNSLIFDLRKIINQKARATLVVSGGSTPVMLFKKLSCTNLAWEKVTITLSDERCVNPKSKHSNANLVKKYLLKYYAKKAKFIPLYLHKTTINRNIKQTTLQLKKLYPFDIIVLGMGEDGHTASLFPNNPKLPLAYSTKNCDILIDITPSTAPFKRISLTKKAIIDTKKIYLYTIGQNKKDIFNNIIKQNDIFTYPVLSILQSDKKVKVFN
jgi:6-phosphogluconolactonase